MYIANPYQNHDQQDIEHFIRTNSFGILINQTRGKLWATHIPLELEVGPDGKNVLRGHISKANLQWEGFLESEDVLAIFSGPHSYISSSWYDYEEVPTWNYAAVHVYGRIKTMNKADLLAHLTRLVDQYEQDSQHPVRLADMSDKTMGQIRGIVGFEISITDIQAVRKFSQTQNQKNFDAIVSHLEKSGTPGASAVAKAMKSCPRSR